MEFVPKPWHALLVFQHGSHSGFGTMLVNLINNDHVNHMINATVHILLSSSLGGLDEDQSLHAIVSRDMYKPNFKHILSF